MKINKNIFNRLLKYINSMSNGFGDTKTYIFDEGDIEGFMLEHGLVLPEELIGYEVKITKFGTHYNDGQLVDYDFIFKSPSGELTKFETQMCLTTGFIFRYKNNININ